jgi:hypothetical protein
MRKTTLRCGNRCGQRRQVRELPPLEDHMRPDIRTLRVMSEEPYFKPPVLQPKTKGISCDLSLNYPTIIEYAIHVLQLTALVN